MRWRRRRRHAKGRGGDKEPGMAVRAEARSSERFAYALARVTAQPLLFKDDDFSQTDVEAC
jgi:uncharacterized protein with PIN domain